MERAKGRVVFFHEPVQRVEQGGSSVQLGEGNGACYNGWNENKNESINIKSYPIIATCKNHTTIHLLFDIDRTIQFCNFSVSHGRIFRAVRKKIMISMRIIYEIIVGIRAIRPMQCITHHCYFRINACDDVFRKRNHSNEGEQYKIINCIEYIYIFFICE